MLDEKIIELYFERNEEAIEKSAEKYGAYCRRIAKNLLNNEEDSEECLNSALLILWNSIPPQKPKNLKLFFAKIARNIALEKLRRKNAKKRGGGETEEIFEELSELIPSDNDTEETVVAGELKEIINSFVKNLPEKESKIFIRRYFFFETPKEIGKRFGFSQNRVSVILHRTRKKLKDYLEKEGYSL